MVQSFLSDLSDSQSAKRGSEHMGCKMQIMTYCGSMLDVSIEDVTTASRLYNLGVVGSPVDGFFSTLIQVLLHG